MGINIGDEPQKAEIKQPWTLKPYAKTQGGVLSLPKNFTLGYASENIGLRLSNGKTYFEADAGIGTAATANLSFGHEFNIGKNLGLELSANGSYANDLINRNLSITVHNNIDVQEEIYNGETHMYTYEYQYNDEHQYNCKYAKTNASATGKATLNIHPNDKLTFKAGGYAGVRVSDVPTVEKNTACTINTTINDYTDEGYINTTTDININNKIRVGKSVITPVIGGSVGISGKRCEANATLGTDGVTIGAKINLGRKHQNKAPQENTPNIIPEK